MSTVVNVEEAIEMVNSIGSEAKIREVLAMLVVSVSELTCEVETLKRGGSQTITAERVEEEVEESPIGPLYKFLVNGNEKQTSCLADMLREVISVIGIAKTSKTLTPQSRKVYNKQGDYFWRILPYMVRLNSNEFKSLRDKYGSTGARLYTGYNDSWAMLNSPSQRQCNITCKRIADSNSGSFRFLEHVE
jgi:hypothetical protein